jgi:hypothetical protein
MPKNAPKKRIKKLRMPKTLSEKHPLESSLFFRRGFWQKRSSKTGQNFFRHYFWQKKSKS